MSDGPAAGSGDRPSGPEVAWWTGVAATEAAVVCGPNLHRLRWEDGTLTALDHLDTGAEAVLAELGGDEPTCLALVRHWSAHAGDARVLALASRHPGDTPGLTSAGMGPVRAEIARRQLAAAGGVAGRAPRRGPGSPHADGAGAALGKALEDHLGLLELLALDPALVRRLQLEVAHRLADEPSPALEAATVGRLAPVLRRWTGGAADVTVRLGERAAVTRRAATVTATVRPDWLAAVWGRYLGVVGGFLVLGVRRIVADRAEVDAVGAPGAEPARLVLGGPAPWRVERRREPT